MKAGATGAPAGAEAARPGLRALVVEGTEEGRRGLETLLRALGMEPTTVSQPHVAMAELWLADRAGRPYSLLLFDAALCGSVFFRARRAGDDPLVAAIPRIELADESQATGGAPSFGPSLSRPVTREALAAAVEEALAGAPRRRPPADTASSPPFDRRRLALRLGDDDAAAHRVLQRFVEHARTYLDGLGAAAGSADHGAIGREVHRLRGDLTWIAADRAAAVAECIEALCRAGQTERAVELCQRLREETESVVSAIRRAEEPSTG